MQFYELYIKDTDGLYKEIPVSVVQHKDCTIKTGFGVSAPPPLNSPHMMPSMNLPFSLAHS